MLQDLEVLTVASYALSAGIFHHLIFTSQCQQDSKIEIWFNMLADKLLTENIKYLRGGIVDVVLEVQLFGTMGVWMYHWFFLAYTRK